MAPVMPENTAINALDKLKHIIRSLLQTVREKYGVVAIEPQLTKDHFDGTIRQLPELCPSHDFKVLLECATKSILYDIAIEPASEERFSSFCNLLDLALVLTELELTDVALPFLLIEDLFDSQTIDSCQRLFEYLESRVERLTTVSFRYGDLKEMDGTKGKGPVLLRLCNELLRRLSKAEDTIFCGRILIFLSKSFILGERSGVNLRGEFNVENTTSFDQIPPAINDEKMDVDQEIGVTGMAEGGDVVREEEAKSTDDSTKVGKAVTFETPASQQQKVDQEVLSADALYPIFWALQNYFSNPTKLFLKESFETFKAGLAATMAKFKAVDEEQSKQGRQQGMQMRRGEEKRKRGSDEDLAAHFNPKYLTSRELFELELSDLTFRRHVLVQALILIDFLLSLTPAAKERWADIPSPNKAVQFSFTLSPEDEKWAIKTRALISEYLQPNFEGRLFMRLVETILTRDKNWVQWKAENCLSFEKRPVPEEEIKRSVGRAMELCRPTRPYPHAMGAPALGRLWKEASKNPGLEGLKRKERHVLPTPESFRPLIKKDEEEIADSLRPDQAETAATSKASKVWRALRIASRDRFHLFNKFVDTPDEDRNELEMLFEIEEISGENSGARGREASTEASVAIAPAEKKPEQPQQQQQQQQPQQRIENIANLSHNQPEMKLRRIENAVTS
ncbi:THO complex subunit 1 transcription elongation factor-domain-containing protein [Kalaharituber pfeilii]|nr:THO complex subunit 1 transcription elongation factor-domain-containing protein [Kalaharituber pfeilii]